LPQPQQSFNTLRSAGPPAFFWPYSGVPARQALRTMWVGNKHLESRLSTLTRRHERIHMIRHWPVLYEHDSIFRVLHEKEHAMRKAIPGTLVLALIMCVPALAQYAAQQNPTDQWSMSSGSMKADKSSAKLRHIKGTVGDEQRLPAIRTTKASQSRTRRPLRGTKGTM